MQCTDELFPALPVELQVIEEVGIARDDPHVAKHLEQHARRAPCAARFAQLFVQAPAFLTDETQEDFTIGKGGVVVRYLADTAGFGHQARAGAI